MRKRLFFLCTMLWMLGAFGVKGQEGSEWVGWGDSYDYMRYENQFKKVVAGPYGSIALTTEGKVITWGLETITGSGVGVNHVPMGLEGIKDIALGSNIAAALDTTGLLRIWTNAPIDSFPDRLENVHKISLKRYHLLVMYKDSTVAAYGQNISGQTDVPKDLGKVRDIVVGDLYSAAITTNDSLVIWGQSPVRAWEDFSDMTGVKAIAGSNRFILGLKNDGSVIKAGNISLPEDFTDGVSIDAVHDKAMLVKKDGSIAVYAEFEYEKPFFAPPEGLEGVRQVTAGLFHVIAVTNDNKAYAWGRTNMYGAMNIPTGLTKVQKVLPNGLFVSPEGILVPANSSDSPFLIGTLDSIGEVLDAFNGLSYTAIVKKDHSVSVINTNFTRTSNFEKYLKAPEDLQDIVAISGGKNHIIALDKYGDVTVWGELLLTKSQETIDLSKPNGLSNVVAIKSSEYGNIALKDDGTVVTWGEALIKQPEGISDVVEISAGPSNMAVLKNDGSIVVWGNDAFGVLDVPKDLGPISSIQLGGVYAMALKEDGTLATWGSTHYIDNLPKGLKGIDGISAFYYNQGFAWGANLKATAVVDAPTHTNLSPFTIGINFTESISQLDETSFQLENGRVESLITYDSINFEVLIKPLGEGNVHIWLEKGAFLNKGGIESEFIDLAKVIYDITPPIVDIQHLDRYGKGKVSVIASFSEEIENFYSNYISSTAKISAIKKLDNTHFEVTVTPEGVQDTIQIVIGNTKNIIRDFAGNPLAKTDTAYFIYDTVKPLPIITSDEVLYTDKEQFLVDVDFQEAVRGFQIGNIEITNAAIDSMITQDSSLFQLFVRPLAEELIKINIDSFSVHDIVGNPNLASNLFSITYWPNSNNISGRLYNDLNSNCTYDEGTDSPIAGYTVRATPSGFYTISREDGTYELLVDQGAYTVEAVLPETQGLLIEQPCGANYQVAFDTVDQTLGDVDFALKTTECPILSVNVSSNRRRRCFENYTTLVFRNEGFAPAEDAKIYLRLPQYVDFVSANHEFTLTEDSVYVFEVGTLAPYSQASIQIMDTVRCEDDITGLDQCTEAWITPANTCWRDAQEVDPEWDKSSLEVEGFCVSNTEGSRFIIRNVGEDMATPSTYRIYENEALASSDNFQLNAGDSLVISYEPYSGSLRLEADQHPAHPGHSLPQATVQGCANVVANRVSSANYFEQDDAAPEISIECLPIIDSYDPNDKVATPQGITENRYVRPETALDYRIRFQNTGTDTAYKVVVVDTLSPLMDISTLRFGASSHPYELTMTGEESPVLTFTFNDIDLVDSLTDEPNSHGFIKFSIAPIAGHPEGTVVHNLADIYFDFNEPIRTNDAWVNYSTYVLEKDGYEFGEDLDLPQARLSAPAAYVNTPFDLAVQVNEEAILEAGSFSASNASITNIQGSGTSYTVTVSPSAEGEVAVALPEGSFTDLAGNPNLASDMVKVVYDITAPTATVSFTANFETLEPFTVDFEFAEPIIGEVELADFEVNNGVAQSIAGEAGKYAVTVQPDAIGSVSVALKAGTVEDRAGNPNARIEETAEVTALSDSQFSALTKLYPNPTTGQLQVEFPWAGAGSKQVQVFNSLGQEVLRTATTSTQSQLDLSKLPAGTYMVQVTAAKGVAVKMVVRE